MININFVGKERHKYGPKQKSRVKYKGIIRRCATINVGQGMVWWLVLYLIFIQSKGVALAFGNYLNCKKKQMLWLLALEALAFMWLKSSLVFPLVLVSNFHNLTTLTSSCSFEIFSMSTWILLTSGFRNLPSATKSVRFHCELNYHHTIKNLKRPPLSNKNL